MASAAQGVFMADNMSLRGRIMEGLSPKDNGTILIVDDTPDHLRLMVKFLENTGYALLIERDAEHVLEKIERLYTVDLILLDILLPGIDGFDLCRRLKQHEATWDIPVIFMTALHDMPDKLKGFEAGGVDYITKPIELEEVLARVRTHIRMRRLQREFLKQNERFRILTKATFEGIIIHNNGTILEVNDAVINLFGYQREELLDQNIMLLMKAESTYMVYQRLFAKDDIPYEVTGIKKDGVCFPVEVQSKILPYSGHIARIAAIRDISWRKEAERELNKYREHLEHLVEQRTTELQQMNESLQQEVMERHRAEQAVRASEQQYRLLAEGMADGIGIIQEDQLIFVNRALCAISNLPVDEVIGKHPNTVFQTDCQTCFSESFEQYKQGQADQFWQVSCTSQAGNITWTEGHLSSIEWGGKPAILLTIQDITDRKLKEIEMTQKRKQLERENRELRSMIHSRQRFDDIIGRSPAMQIVYDAILKAADSDANVVIYGESGTGKDLIARTIHQRGTRRDSSFVPVNCGAIPEPLFESEFFGHRKGAFTGAHRDKPGFFDIAHQGTLFLDEVDSLTLTMQAKLLRAIEGGGYAAVGDPAMKKMNIRIIVASNQDFTHLVRNEKMRLDFFYRIHVISIHIPPLREHKEDIPLLIQDMLEQYRNNGNVPQLPGHVIDALMRYDWPGNVRELQNVLNRYLTLGRLMFSPLNTTNTALPDDHVRAIESEDESLQRAVEAFEKQVIQRTLEQNSGHKGKTADKLHVDPKTLYRKLKYYQLE